jgi:hypothetical protein
VPIDPQSRRNLIKRQVKARDKEHDASLSDEERLEARRQADFYEQVRIKLNENQTTDSNNQ